MLLSPQEVGLPLLAQYFGVGDPRIDRQWIGSQAIAQDLFGARQVARLLEGEGEENVGEWPAIAVFQREFDVRDRQVRLFQVEQQYPVTELRPHIFRVEFERLFIPAP